MKAFFVALALMGSALANPLPQAPDSPAPDSCSKSADGTFQLTVVNVTDSSSKRAIEKRQQSGLLTLKLADGTLTDQADRTGYIASNFQFQFDSPPQAGAIYTVGFSLCSNNTLALGGSAIFYQCWSGGFFNLYDRQWAEHCVPIYLTALKEGGSQPPLSEAPDGQPQVPTQAPVSQISDGQPQAPTNPVVISQISDGQPQVPTAVPVISQISDGQPQVPTAGPVITQISDGQPQVPTAGPIISQISDGQPQVPTSPAGPVVSQISDGQPQVPTAPAPAPVPPGPIISQISDGQPQVPTASTNYTIPAPSAPQFTGAAATPIYGLGALAAGMMGVAAML